VAKRSMGCFGRVHKDVINNIQLLCRTYTWLDRRQWVV
jgi:hypothetical protein